MSLPEIFLCGCVYDYENQQIVLFYNGNMDINILRQELKQKLPSYMIPTRIDKLNSIPRTPTGKINRNALKSLL
jgi:acyl-coenzyme A synthetase/AMP-(fatty) acid ligase